MTSEKSYIEDIIDQINSKNAKKIAFILVLGFATYHGLLHISYGNFCMIKIHKYIYANDYVLGTNSCKWLLTDGRYKGDQEWQPYGCMLHLYSKM